MSDAFLVVVAAAIDDGVGRLLLQQRPVGKRHATLWEFPGGKVDGGEQTRDALIREIDEELGIRLDLASLKPAGFAEEKAGADAPAILLLLYAALIDKGVPLARERQRWGWFTPEEASQLDLAPMDRELLRKWRL